MSRIHTHPFGNNFKVVKDDDDQVCSHLTSFSRTLDETTKKVHPLLLFNLHLPNLKRSFPPFFRDFGRSSRRQTKRFVGWRCCVSRENNQIYNSKEKKKRAFNLLFSSSSSCFPTKLSSVLETLGRKTIYKPSCDWSSRRLLFISQQQSSSAYI